MNANDNSSAWDKVYADTDYRDVFSITQDEAVCEALSKRIPQDAKNILIPGCGNRIHLQKYIIEKTNPRSNLYCTDWSDVALQLARKRYSSPNINYLREDSSCLSFPDEMFDVVVNCNGVVSSDDDDNKKMVREFSRVLKKGGTLIGLFPTIFSSLDGSINCPEKRRWQTDKTILINEMRFFDKPRGIYQIYYSPLQLRKILKASDFNIDEFSIHFFDSEVLLQEGQRVYGIPEHDDLPVWEIMVRVHK